MTLSCGIKISAVHHLDLSQSTRVTDGQTDGRTDTITTLKTALAYAGVVKTLTLTPSFNDVSTDGLADLLNYVC